MRFPEVARILEASDIPFRKNGARLKNVRHSTETIQNGMSAMDRSLPVHVQPSERPLLGSARVAVNASKWGGSRHARSFPPNGS